MELSEVISLLKSVLRRPVYYHKAFTEIAGRVGAGVMLSQAWYWTPRTDDEDGWFYKTSHEWSDETGMSRTEQETARKRLVGKGLLEEKLMGMPGKMHFRVNTEKLILLLVENPPTGRRRKSRQQVGRKPANTAAGNLPTNLITATTQRTTAQTPQDKPRPPKSSDPLAEDRADLLAFLIEKNGVPRVPGTQTKAINWLLSEAGCSPDECKRCFTYLISQTWRNTAVTWKTVGDEIGAWKSRGEPAMFTNGNGNGRFQKTTSGSDNGNGSTSGVRSEINTSLPGRIKRAF